MPKDEWEPDDDELEEGEQDDEDGPETLSDEDRAALETLKASGMSATELAARARRDLETEATRRREEAGRGNREPQEEGIDDKEVLTGADAKRLMAAAREQARMEVRAGGIQQRLESGIAGTMKATTGFEDATPDEVADITTKVTRELGKIPGIESMDAVRFDAEVVKATKKALEAERKRAQRIRGEAPEELDERLEAARATGASGRRGGPAKRSTVAPTGARDQAGDLDPFDEPIFGVDGQNWPTQDQLEARHQRELTGFSKRKKAGR